MARRLRLELSVEGDTAEDLVAGLDDALRKFREVGIEGHPDLEGDETEVVMDSAPHPAAGWSWRWVEDLDAPSSAQLAREAHIAAGGAVRHPRRSPR